MEHKTSCNRMYCLTTSNFFTPNNVESTSKDKPVLSFTSSIASAVRVLLDDVERSDERDS